MTFAITSFLILFICSLGAGEGLPSEKLMVSYQQLLLTFSENTQVFFKYNLTLLAKQPTKLSYLSNLQVRNLLLCSN